MAINKTNDEIEVIDTDIKVTTSVAGNTLIELPATVTTSTVEQVIEVLSGDSELKLYDIYPTNPLLTTIKFNSIYANNNKDLPNLKGKMKANKYDNDLLEIIYKSPSIEFTVKFENFGTSMKSINFRKTLNYLWIEANKQNYNERIEFSLSDYQKRMGYASKDVAYRALKRYSEELTKLKISNTKFKYNNETNKKSEQRFQFGYMFYAGDISYTYCVIKTNSDSIRKLPMYISVLPTWTGKLGAKSYDLADYIYTQCRQKANQKKIIATGKFNISLQAINTYVGGFSPNETERHTQLIIKPILDAIKDIEANRVGKEIGITVFHANGYKNANEFLKGYIEIEIDEYIIKHAIQLNNKREKLQNKNNEINKLKKANTILKSKKNTDKNNS